MVHRYGMCPGGAHAGRLVRSGRGWRCVVATVSEAASLLAAAEVPAPVRIQAAGPSANGGSKATVAEAPAEAKRTKRPVVVGSMMSEVRTVEMTPSGSFIATEQLRPAGFQSTGSSWDYVAVGYDASLAKVSLFVNGR